MDERLHEFLDLLYETMSFENADAFDSFKFESLFSPNAMLVELSNGVLRSETILEYVNRFLYELRHFPENYSHGLAERQVGCEVVTGEDFLFVKSDYEKKYSDGERVERGCNHMTLCRDGDWFRILFIAWSV